MVVFLVAIMTPKLTFIFWRNFNYFFTLNYFFLLKHFFSLQETFGASYQWVPPCSCFPPGTMEPDCGPVYSHLGKQNSQIMVFESKISSKHKTLNMHLRKKLVIFEISQVFQSKFLKTSCLKKFL